MSKKTQAGQAQGAPHAQSSDDARAREPAAEWVALNALHPWANNPRKNDDAAKKVAESIKRFGFAAPIVARTNGQIIAGHTRWKAAHLLGLDRVPVRYVDLDSAEAHLLALADNKLNEAADWNYEALESILGSIDSADALLAGWSEDELKPPDDIELSEVDVASIQSEFWLSVRGPLPAQPDARTGEALSAIALSSWVKRCSLTPLKMWQAEGYGSGKGAAKMVYTGIVFEGNTVS